MSKVLRNIFSLVELQFTSFYSFQVNTQFPTHNHFLTNPKIAYSKPRIHITYRLLNLCQGFA